MLNRAGLSLRGWLWAASAALIAASLLCLLVFVPAAVRALPGRYAARLPGFLQDLRHRPHPDLLPTPALVVAPPTLLLPTPTLPPLRGVTIVTSTPVRRQVSTRSLSSPQVEPTRPTSQPTSEPTPPPPPTPTPIGTATPAPTPTALPVQASLPPLTHTYQTWNNCGPATLSMALRYFDRTETQADAAAFLKPDPEDKNVSPDEMAAYARSLGLEATVRVGGDLTRLKQLLGAGFPVLVETWFIPEPGDQMGHYRLLTGYDDAAGHFIAHDSYNGPNVHLEYAAFDELWRVFNRVYLVVYYPDQTGQLAALLGDEMNDAAMYTRALDTARLEALNPSAECVAYEDCADAAAFAWFNVGSNLTHLGRHADAAAAYDQARVLGLPWRTLWYQFGPYQSYYAVGRYDDVITLTNVTLGVVDNLEESHYWRGMAYLAQENSGQARADFQAALKYNPHFTLAAEALESLE